MRPLIALLILLVLLTAVPAGAESSGLPRLGDHIFVPVMDLTEPFLVTQVQTTVSLGRATNASVPVLTPEGDAILGSVKADLVVAGIGFGYRHAVKDWLAVDLSFNTFGRIGTSTPSLLAEGLTGAIGYDIGWLLRIHESRDVMVTGAVNLSSRSGTFVNLLDWASGIVEGVNVPLVRGRSSLGGNVSALAAWGVSERFGLLGEATVHYVESFHGIGENEYNADVRIAASYDARVDIDVPLGIALTGAYFEEENSNGGSVSNWMWSLRFGLQGRDDFTIGLNLSTYYTELAYSSTDLTLHQVAIDMRYYF